MRRVILESPFAADTKQGIRENMDYARRCIADSLSRGEAPIASHMLYTQPGVLNDDIPEERQKGIDAGLSWIEVADGSVVYCDRGISKGMWYGAKAATDADKPVEYRFLDQKDEG